RTSTSPSPASASRSSTTSTSPRGCRSQSATPSWSTASSSPTTGGRSSTTPITRPARTKADTSHGTARRTNESPRLSNVVAMPAPKMLVELLARSLPYSTRPVPLLDRTQDPGLFGPDSVTWRVMREPLLILSAGRALLMQAANPLVAQGAIDHSSYQEDPYGRLERTVEWVTVVCFGTTSEAR